ncbi:hypothetical protein [uncultured Jatrophihabitans sp.]
MPDPDDEKADMQVGPDAPPRDDEPDAAPAPGHDDEPQRQDE